MVPPLFGKRFSLSPSYPVTWGRQILLHSDLSFERIILSLGNAGLTPSPARWKYKDKILFSHRFL